MPLLPRSFTLSSLALALATASACAQSAGRTGEGAMDECVGAKCDGHEGGDDELEGEANACWTDAETVAATTEPVADSEICELLAAAEPGGLLLAEGTPLLGWQGPTYGDPLACRVYIGEGTNDLDVCGSAEEESDTCRCFGPGSQCRVVVPLDDARLAEAAANAAGLRPDATNDGEDLCALMHVAQRRCRGLLPVPEVPGGDVADFQSQLQPCGTPTSCEPGLEQGCLQYVPPWIDAADPASLVPLQTSRCTGATFHGVGYSPVATYDASFDSSCLGSNASNRSVVQCEFLGQTVDVDEGFCEVLSGCVEPALDCWRSGTTSVIRYDREGNRVEVQDVAVYDFPTGSLPLRVDLDCVPQAEECMDLDPCPEACGGGCALRGNHSTLQGCRALDINVPTNGGNLSGITETDPEVNLPPEMVAVMEECGLVWGGRFHGAIERPHVGCDPMHFDYAPTCFERAPRTTPISPGPCE